MSDTEAKKHKASGRKLSKQREEGSVANSQDLAGFASVAVGLCVVAGTATLIWQKLASNIVAASELVVLPFDEALSAAFTSFGQIFLWALLPVVGAVISVAFLASILYNKGLLFAMKPVQPQLNRVSPMAGMKRIYGKRGWVEFGVGLVRILVWLGFATAVMALLLPKLFASVDCAGLCQAHLARPIAWFLAMGAAACFLIAAAAEGVIQSNLFLGEQRMTESEVKRERKDQHGSTEVRRERRRLMKDARNASGKTGVEHANMCFYFDEMAIAIHFAPPNEKLPRIVAKARGAGAAAELRATVTSGGWPERESANITRAGIGKDLGGALDSAVFQDFADALQEMFET